MQLFKRAYTKAVCAKTDKTTIESTYFVEEMKNCNKEMLSNSNFGDFESNLNKLFGTF